MLESVNLPKILYTSKLAEYPMLCNILFKMIVFI